MTIFPPSGEKKTQHISKARTATPKALRSNIEKKDCNRLTLDFWRNIPGSPSVIFRNVTRRRSHECHSNKCRVKPLTYVLQNKLLVSTHVPEPGVITPINTLFSFLQFRPKAHKNSAWPWTCVCSPPQFLPWACLASGCRRLRPQR